jgi:hypothetical protein
MNKTITILALCFSLSGCNHDDARSAWTSVIDKCARSQLNGKILYFGPSNNIGPGSVWRKPEGGGFRVRYSLAEMPGNSVFITQGTPSSCDGSSETKFGTKASVGLSTSLSTASAEVQNDFQKATNIQVRAGSIAWDIVKEGPYEAYVRALPSVGGVREDLAVGDRLVLYRALRVIGYSATLEFSTSDAAALKAKYSGVLPKSVTGDVSAEMAATWSTDNKLTLTSTGDFYLAGELVPFKPAGFASVTTAEFGLPLDVQRFSGDLGIDKRP